MRISATIQHAFGAVILGTLVFASLAQASASPSITFGRNGVSEFYLRRALVDTAALLQSCTREPSCIQGVEDSVQTLKDSGLPESTRLVFLSSRELGSHLYRLDPDNVIAINRDLLVIARNGVLNPYTYPDAVDFLIRAWAERLHYSDPKMRTLAYRLSMSIYYKWERVASADSFLGQFSFGLIRGPIPALVLEDNGGGDAAVTMEAPFSTWLSCTTSTGFAIPMRDLKITEARWEKASNLTFSHALIQVTGKLAYSCPTGGGTEVSFTSDYQVQVDVNFRQGVWSMNSSSLRIQQNGIRLQN